MKRCAAAFSNLASAWSWSGGLSELGHAVGETESDGSTVVESLRLAEQQQQQQSCAIAQSTASRRVAATL